MPVNCPFTWIQWGAILMQLHQGRSPWMQTQFASNNYKKALTITNTNLNASAAAVFASFVRLKT